MIMSATAGASFSAAESFETFDDNVRLGVSMDAPDRSGTQEMKNVKDKTI